MDENKAWERFQQRIHNNGAKEERPVVKKKNLSWLRVAASIALIVAIGAVTYNIMNRERVVNLLAETYQDVLTDTLSDGSVVTLNKESSLAYPSRFKGDTRTVTLKGEAFFHVTPDKEKPFTIHVNDVDVTVVGTSFNIKSKNGITEVIVETGIVRVTKEGETIELKAGEKTTIGTTVNSIKKEEVTDQLYNYYRTKEFVCENTPLWKLVEVLNEAYNVHIVIGREELKNLPITSPFYNESLDRVLELISLTFDTYDIKITRKDDQIILE